MDVIYSKNPPKSRDGSWNGDACSNKNRQRTYEHNFNYVGPRCSFGNIFNHLLVTFFTLVSTISQVKAQGVQICSCAPPVYAWRIDFTGFSNPGPNGECPLDITGYSNGGAKGIPLCQFEFDAPNFNNDFVPVKLTEFSIIEVNERLEGRKRLGVVNDTFQGQQVEFSSIINLDPPEIPGGFQAEFKAENAAGQPFKLNISMRFSNTCEILPFSVGDVLGYLVFTEIEQPPAAFCNFASESPTMIFSSPPSIHPTDSPSVAPTYVPTLSPTKTMEPSLSVSPSIALTSEPSNSEGCVGGGKGKKMRAKGKGKGLKSSQKPGKGKGLKSSQKPGKGKGKSKKGLKSKKGKGGKGKKKGKKCETYSIMEPIKELGVPLNEIIIQVEAPSNHHGKLRGLR
mmetsp:Transcript_4121/g.5059  ORF Transcript_4121/g.5059 Transcript_4121/m.5059 type:complete len:397 (+) Transcript_4121:314-1504(+)